jgi:ATP diphosphatase
MAEEAGHFTLSDVIAGISDKMVRRHPHVFGDTRDLTPAEVKALWHRIKLEEKAAKSAARADAGLPPKPEDSGVLSGVPLTMPALTRAWKLQARASSVGFDWNDARLVLAKIREEIDEVEEALEAGDKAAMREEVGDLLFAVANLARHLDAEPEGALVAANAKFERRFKGIEAALEAEGRTAKDASLDEMETLWQAVKKAEKAGA